MHPAPWPAEQPVLSDGEVLLGPWSDRDAEWLHETCQDPEIQRWTLVPSPYELLDAVEFVEVVAPSAFAAHTGVHLAITEADGSERLGAVGLMVIDPASGVGELSYYLAPGARGRGVASRAVSLLAGWAEEELGLCRLELHVLAGNVASLRLAERLGFEREGVLRSRELHRGERHDVVLLARLRGIEGGGSG
jgi:RimJ/RimL family protein N-acetyltransferase